MSFTSLRRRRCISAAAMAAGALVLTACGGGSSGASATSADTAALGTKKPATGSTVKIGFVVDGATAGITQVPEKKVIEASVKYANDYLGGLGGHKIEVEFCETQQTPAGAAACVSQFAKDKLPIALNNTSGQGNALFVPLAKAGVPVFVNANLVPDTFASDGIDILFNGVGALAAPAQVAKDAGIKRAAVIVIDVPAATGPIGQLANIVYGKAGIPVDIVAIPPGTPDMTPQITAELKKSPGQMVVIGDKSFEVTAFKAMQTAKYKGQSVGNTGIFDKTTSAGLNNVKGTYVFTAATTDHASPEFKVYRAAMDTYGLKGVNVDLATGDYQIVIALVRATAKLTGEATKESIQTALHTAGPLPYPLADGATFDCSKKHFTTFKNFCTTSVLATQLDAEGQGTTYKVVDVANLMNF